MNRLRSEHSAGDRMHCSAAAELTQTQKAAMKLMPHSERSLPPVSLSGTETSAEDMPSRLSRHAVMILYSPSRTSSAVPKQSSFILLHAQGPPRTPVLHHGNSFCINQAVSC